MRSRARLAVEIEDAGIIGIIRGIEAATSKELADAIYQGGIRVIEVTLNTRKALSVIEILSDAFSNQMLIGAGTVIDSEGARAAIDAGAEFLVTPTFSPDVIHTASRYGKPVISGAMTPTEALAAYETGADFVKVFPAASLGPEYIAQIKAPLSQIPIVAVGGVSSDNAREFIKAGAVAVGVGGSLVDKAAISRGDWECIAREAKKLTNTVCGVC